MCGYGSDCGLAPQHRVELSMGLDLQSMGHYYNLASALKTVKWKRLSVFRDVKQGVGGCWSLGRPSEVSWLRSSCGLLMRMNRNLNCMFILCEAHTLSDAEGTQKTVNLMKNSFCLNPKHRFHRAPITSSELFHLSMFEEESYDLIFRSNGFPFTVILLICLLL